MAKARYFSPMPTLANARQERFCQLVKRGIPPWRAYAMAGYNHHESAPYRLCGNARVKARINELTRHIAVKTRVTVESLTQHFDRAIELAEATQNPAALTNAAVAKGKLHGLMVDRKESGAPGDFATLADNEAIIAKVRQDLGEAMGDAFAAFVAQLGAREAEAAPELPAIEPASDTTH